MQSKDPLVSVIVVNYNGKKHLKTCFSSLSGLNYTQEKLEIIMVDNASRDGSVPFVRKNFPQVKIIKSTVNNYAKANNMGIESSAGEFVALVNNDVKVDKDWLAELVKVIQKDKKIGAVGSKILFMDGSVQSVGHREYPDFYWGDIGFMHKDGPEYNQIKEVSSICGCSILFRKKCLEQVGLLDEDFNLYMEDIDMAVRCKKKKWKLVICPQSVIYHRHHGTIGSEDDATDWQEMNRLLLVAKHWPDQLPAVLAGRGHYSKKNNHYNPRDIGDVFAKLVFKLAKEHGEHYAHKMTPKLFDAVRKIYNFEKDYLMRMLREKDDYISDHDKIISGLGNSIEQKDQELTKKNQELRTKTRELEERRQELMVKTRDLVEKNSEIEEIKRDIAQRDQALEQKNRELLEKDQKLGAKDEIIKSLTENLEIFRQKSVKANSLEFLLKKTQKELDDVYMSTGFKYIIRPLWNFLWPLKQVVKRVLMQIASLRNASKSSAIKEDEERTPGRLKSTLWKIDNGSKYFLTKESWKNVYASHIKRGTYPPKPQRMTLMLNRICNLRCLFCDVPERTHQEKTMPKEKAFKVIDQAWRLGIKEMILTGGEPFLHPELFEIIQYGKAKDIKSVITTNGLLVKRHIDKLIASDVDCVGVSIDGRKETHDFLRNCPGAYEKAMEAVAILKDNNINTAVNFVVTNKNVGQLEEVYEDFSRQGIKVSFLPVINKPDLFLSSDRDKKTYMEFINKLKTREEVSVPEYDYLKLAMLTQFNQETVYTRCLGMSNEIGIDTEGNIAPCCVWENRKNELNHLGNVDGVDLEELWYSPEFRDVRLSILERGCENCFNPSVIDMPRLTGMGFVVRGGKSRKEEAKPAVKENRIQIKDPNHVHMRFTSRCNLACRHCDIWKAGKPAREEISVEEWKRCIDKLYAWLGNFKLDLAGGEILLYKGAIPLIQYCVEKGITVNLTTNATLIDDRMAEKIVNSGLYCVNLSLDGLEDVHCYTRNNSYVFEKVREAAMRLKKYKKYEIPYISLTTVVHKFNLKQLPEIVRLTDQWGINNIGFQALDHRFGAQYDHNWFMKNEFWPTNFSEVNEAIDELIRMKRKGVRIDNSVQQLNAFKRYFKNPKEELKSQCFSGFKNFIVNEYGEVLLCWNMAPVGSLLDNDPRKIWVCDEAVQRRAQIARCQRTCRILNCNYV